MRYLLALALLGVNSFAAHASPEPITIGSKKFTESVILGEMAVRLARHTGADTQHREQLGGTRILFNALTRGEIDVYAEYTGTLRYEIFADDKPTDEQALREHLAEHGLRMSAPLGFANNYALGMRRERAERLGIETVADLREHPRLALGFSNEFLDRADGWPGLKRAYELARRPRGMDHDLALRALAADQIAVTDVYTTDAEITYYDLKLLADPKGYFRDYRAVWLYRDDLDPAVVAALDRAAGQITSQAMRAMNAAVKLEAEPAAAVAAGFLRRELGLTLDAVDAHGWPHRLWRHGLEHLFLVGMSLGAAIATAIPLGVLAAAYAPLRQPLLAMTGLAQTIPSLALLVFMIPLLGIGAAPAIAALFVYSLLPIVRNTVAGIVGVPRALQDSATGLGLPLSARLRLVYLPLATPAILAGIKTAAVINVGTATRGALIGAGGYGQPILTGIRLDDTALILQGAVPAAALALLVQGAFDLTERYLVPRGLR